MENLRRSGIPRETCIELSKSEFVGRVDIGEGIAREVTMECYILEKLRIEVINIGGKTVVLSELLKRIGRDPIPEKASHRSTLKELLTYPIWIDSARKIPYLHAKGIGYLLHRGETLVMKGITLRGFIFFHRTEYLR
ncbi:hypothetical protein [Spirochaeta thermophila]|uniref:hypothetical protein n=1 Tax=Winmispira thermophila TaxID=154 RepID=UPI0012DE6E14|nr:hypothetical protein [Spirochaeta thermophila]